MSSIIIQVPLFFKIPFIQFLLGPSAYSWNSKMAEVSEGKGNANLLSLLEKLHLGHLLGNFQREKATVDQICKSSDKQIECLGVNHRNTKMTLTLKCLTFGSDPPPKKPEAQGSETIARLQHKIK